MSAPLVALTGGTGFVGQALVDLAGWQGVSLRALARRGMAPRPLVEWQTGALDDRAALARLVRGTEAVIHVAGVVNTPDPAVFQQANVEGTLALIEAAKAAGVPRFIFVSSLSARAPELSAYGASKAEAERLVKASGLDWTIVRPPTIYGPRDRDVLELFRAARWGMVPMPAQGAASVIHVDDLARLLLALIPSGRGVVGHTFEPDDGLPGGWPHAEFARAIGAAVGKRVRVLGLSPGAMTLAAKGDRLLRGDKAKLTLDRVGYMTHPDWVVNPEAAVPEHVWAPGIETRGGLITTAEWYRKEGWL